MSEKGSEVPDPCAPFEAKSIKAIFAMTNTTTVQRYVFTKNLTLSIIL
jgi:hypothetical protein